MKENPKDTNPCQETLAAATAHLSGVGGPDAARDRLEQAVGHLASCRSCRASLDPGDRARFVFEVSLSRA